MTDPASTPFPAPGAAQGPRATPRSLLSRVEDAIAVVTGIREEAVRAAAQQPEFREMEEHVVTALRELHVLRHKLQRG